jgi:NADPH2:quinone reductase
VDDQVLIEVRAVGVNPVETYVRSGSNPKQALPYTPGTDACGVVVATGHGVLHVKAGDRVYTSGTLTGAYAEYTLCREGQVHKLPGNLDFESGGAINIPYATAHRALFHRARARKGESVLIHGGSGGVGIASIQLGREAGLAIIATVGSERGAELVLHEGAHHVVNHGKAGYQDEILALTDGEGVDIILEMLANVNLGADPRLLTRNGRIIVIGSRGKVEINPRDLMTKDADVRGMMLFNTPEDEMERIHRSLAVGFEKRSLRPIIGKRFPLKEAARAHEAVMEPRAYGKIILTVGDAQE